MVEPFASDRLRRAPGSVAAAAAPSLAALHHLLAPTARPDDRPTGEAQPGPRPPRGTADAGTATRSGQWPALHALPHAAAAAAAPTPLPSLVAAPTFAAGYAEFRDAALERPAVAAAYLATIRQQADALARVWEAHLRGAATLPPAVAAAVRGALGEA
jgi:hypothetical protein